MFIIFYCILRKSFIYFYVTFFIFFFKININTKKRNKKYEIKLCICTKKKTNCKKFVNLFV